MDEHQDFLQDSELERLDFSDSVFTPPLSEGTTSAADCSISAVSQDPALPMNVSLPVPMQCFPSPASKAFGPGQQMYMASQAVATAATGAHSSAGALQHPSRTPSLASSQCEASHQSPAEPWADNDSLCSSQVQASSSAADKHFDVYAKHRCWQGPKVGKSLRQFMLCTHRRYGGA